MLSLKSKLIALLSGKLVVAAVLFAATFSLASVSEAATVYNCSKTTNRCVIKLEDGIVGDRVQVLDEKAQEVARGYILRRKGSYAIISLVHVSKNIRKGYPVIVNLANRNSNLQWAGSFSSQDY